MRIWLVFLINIRVVIWKWMMIVWIYRGNQSNYREWEREDQIDRVWWITLSRYAYCRIAMMMIEVAKVYWFRMRRHMNRRNRHKRDSLRIGEYVRHWIHLTQKMKSRMGSKRNRRDGSIKYSNMCFHLRHEIITFWYFILPTIIYLMLNRPRSNY